MKYLKSFESRTDIWNVDVEDVKEIFSDFIDDFRISVVFGKKLHQFNVVDTNVTDQDIKLGFKPYIQVRLVSEDRQKPYTLNQYINSDEFLGRQSEIVSKLDYLDLELHKVYVEVSSIIFLIYTKNSKLYAKL
jgi:predicted RNA-binding protein